MFIQIRIHFKKLFSKEIKDEFVGLISWSVLEMVKKEIKNGK